MAAETPTIVLVHGAWADATGFDAEIRALRDRGYSAIGFGNPLRDLAGDANYLADFEAALERSSTPGELIDRLAAAYPDLANPYTLWVAAYDLLGTKT